MRIYRLIMVLALPGLLGLLLWRRLWRREPARALPERLGMVVPDRGGLWLHGASNGELTSAHWLIERLVMLRPGLPILITANTATAVAMVESWRLPGVTAAFAPLDGAGAPGRVLARRQPKALIVIENELWPARIAAAARAGVPVLVLGARMSARSAARWRHLSGLIGAMLGRISWLCAQDEASQARLVELGLKPAALGPVFDLKAQVGGTVGTTTLPGPAPRSECLLAASTHEGEEELVLDAFAAARRAGRFSHLILAPRHPRRSSQIAAMIGARGLAFTKRSDGQMPQSATPVFLADTMGEMDLWYAMAGVCVIGGSFAHKGGHTPWEPIRHGCAVIHGPSVENFAETFSRLDAAGGALSVTAEGLAAALIRQDAAHQSRIAAAAGVLAPKADTEMLVQAVLRQAGL